MRTWSRLRVGAALLGAGALLAAAPVIPDPVLIETTPELPARLAIVPAVEQVALGPEGSLVVHHIENGLGETIELTLAAVAVTPGPDGAPVAGEGAAEGWRLPAGRVVLGPGERARVTSVARATGVVQLTATPPGGDPLIAYVVAGEGPPGRIDATTSLGAGGVELELVSAGAPSVVEVRIRLAPPLGPAVVDETVGPLVLLGDAPRRLTWGVELPTAPWPLELDVEVLGDEGPVATASTRIWPDPGPWLAAAVVLVGLTGGLVTGAVRTRRRATV